MKGTKLVRGPWFWLVLAALSLGLAGYGWLERQQLQAWYHAFRVVRLAEPTQREPHVAALAQLKPHGWRVLARQLDCRNEERRTRAADSMVELLSNHLAGGDAREIARSLAQEQAKRSPAGQAATLRCLRALLLASEGEAVDAWVTVAASALANAQGEADACLQQALETALVLARRADPIDEEWLTAWVKLTERAVADEREEVVASGIRLAMATGSKQALEAVRPRLHDKRKEVRAFALAALGAREELIPTDDLLPLLHDVDAQVRSLCEQSLRSRGLSPQHLLLAREMTHPQAAIRARVAGQVFDHGELDARLWLERLSRDKSPAVRASVARAAARDPDGRFVLRLHQMTLEDPSPTVRQIAEYYLSSRQQRQE